MRLIFLNDLLTEIKYPRCMKTKLLTLLLSLTFLFLFSGSVFGEEPEVKKEYWDNGRLKSETHYKNGKEEGLETFWYKTGKKKNETHYKNGKENGILKTWDKDGNITFQGNFVDGKKQ